MCRRARSVPRTLLGAGLVCLVFAAGCSRATSVDGTEVATRPTSEDKNPSWITRGYEIADRYRASQKPLSRPTGATPTTQLPTGPSKAQFVATLTAVGIGTDSAECIWAGVEGTPVAEKIAPLLSGGAIPAIDDATVRQLTVAVAPCIDTQTLLTLLASGVGGSGNGLASLLGALGTSGAAGQLTSLTAGGGSTQLARSVGTNLSPQQIAALAQAINAGALGQLAGLDPSSLDLTKLDLNKLSDQELVVLIAALARGLTPEQQNQVRTLANVSLNDLNLQVDPDRLTTEQAGAIFVLLLPFISAGIVPPNPQPPAGGGADQIYIPPGTDLSSINPLYFVPEQNLVQGLQEQGVRGDVAACLYNRLRVLDPRAIALAFTGNDLTAASQVVLSALACVISPSSRP